MNTDREWVYEQAAILQFLRDNLERYNEVVGDFPGIILKHFMDGGFWMPLLAACPLAGKRRLKMLRLFNASYKKDPKKAIGIMFSMLTDHLLSESFRLGLPQVMISRVVRHRRAARKSTNSEFKNKYALQTRMGVRALIEAIIEKQVLNLDGCR